MRRSGWPRRCRPTTPPAPAAAARAVSTSDGWPTLTSFGASGLAVCASSDCTPASATAPSTGAPRSRTVSETTWPSRPPNLAWQLIGEARIVRDHEDGGADGVELADELHDRCAG